jgi:GNAT superfamily N-acetyltransferase
MKKVISKGKALPPVSIRRADEAVAFPLSKMVAQNIAQIHKDYGQEGVSIWQRGYSGCSLVHQIRTRTVFVLLLDGKVAGMIQCSNKHEIKGFYIATQYIGKGYGRLLFEYLICWLKEEKGIEEVELTSNPRMVPLYEHLGFRIVGEEQVYWEHVGFTEVRMKMHLG